jgi:hypothetical protein
MDSESTLSSVSSNPPSLARCIYKSNRSILRYTLVAYDGGQFKRPLSIALKEYRRDVHGYVHFSEERGWVLAEEKRESGIFIRPILDALSKSKKMHESMKSDTWLIVRGEPSYAENLISEMLMDDIYRIDSYDIWKIKIDDKSYHIAVVTC